jgi:copper homeostasis protein
MFQLEVIAFSITSCHIAAIAGANRIELCDNPYEGGTTPSYGMIKAARSKAAIELFPIIRPRGGDFLYSNDEFEVMKNDISICKSLGCDGVVIGLLLPNGSVDKLRTEELVALAYPMQVTFHRAFDRVENPYESLEVIIDCGCKRILTSGLQPTAIEGSDLLTKLVQQAGNRISIMPGSGIRPDNILSIQSITGAKEFHSSARRLLSSAMHYKNPLMNENLQSYELDSDQVHAMRQLLDGIQ